jgi:hypothetical protein
MNTLGSTIAVDVGTGVRAPYYKNLIDRVRPPTRVTLYPFLYVRRARATGQRFYGGRSEPVALTLTQGVGLFRNDSINE